MGNVFSCSYESSSSDESSSESSDEGSDSSEYHEAREKLPESTIQHQHIILNTSKPQDGNMGDPQQAAANPAVIPDSSSSQADTKLPDNAPPSPATHTVVQKCASQPTSDSTQTALAKDCKETPDRLSENTAAQKTPSTLPHTESASSVTSVKTSDATKQQHTAQSETSAASPQQENKPAAERVPNDSGSAPSDQVR